MIGYFTVWIVRTVSLQKIIRMHVNWFKQVICVVILFVQVFLALNSNIITMSLQIICLMILVFLQHISIKKVVCKLLTKIKR